MEASKIQEKAAKAFLHILAWLTKALPYLLNNGLVFLLLGCTTASFDEPDRTTYPRDLVREENMIIPLAAARSNLNIDLNNKSSKDAFSHRRTTEVESDVEWSNAIIGDSAEHEVRVVPRVGENMSETALRLALPQLGRQSCGERYRITMTRYYLGTEASSALRGINHPWLLAHIRCPVQVDVTKQPISASILAASSDIPDADYFDVHEKDFTLDKDELLALFRRVVSARGWTATEKIIQENVYLVTDRYRAGIIGAPKYEQLVAIIAPHPGGSTLAFRLVLHRRDFEGTSDATGSIRLTPMPRDLAYREAIELLGELRATPNG